MQFDSREKKMEFIVDNSSSIVQGGFEVDVYKCTVCGKEYIEDLFEALSCCNNDCTEDLEDMAHDFRFDQLRDEGRV